MLKKLEISNYSNDINDKEFHKYLDYLNVIQKSVKRNHLKYRKKQKNSEKIRKSNDNRTLFLVKFCN